MAKLGDICIQITDGSHNPPMGVEQSNYLMLSSKNIDDDHITFNDPRYLSQEDFEAENKRTNIKPNDLLITIVGTIGRVAIVPNSLTEFCVQRSVAVLKPKPEMVYNRFLMYYLQNMRPYLEQESRGVAQKGIYLKQLSNLSIILPPLDEQRKIAAALDKVSDLIAKRRQQLDKLDELIKAKFVEMFGNININDKGWNIQPLGEFCTIVRGGSPRPIDKYLGGDVPWIKISDATEGESIYLNSTKEHIIREGVSKSRMVKSGSLIFANCGVSLGFARIITFDGCIHDGWLAMEDIDLRLNKIFLLHTLNQMTEHFRKIAPAGTQPNLNTSIMKAYKQIIPPMQLQNEFILFVEQTEKTKTTISKSLEQLETLKKALMQKYFG